MISLLWLSPLKARVIKILGLMNLNSSEFTIFHNAFNLMEEKLDN